MRFSLIVIEENTRRPVQLRDDDSLGSINNERTVVSHQRHFAKIDFLLTYVFYGFVRAACLFVVNDETNFDANRRGIGKTTHLTFFDIKYRLTQSVADIVECGVSRVADNRKYGLKCCVQTNVLAVFFRHIRLQKFSI